MKKNHIKSFLKFLRKNKLFSFINLLGLSIALCVSFPILLYAVNELSYDRCHKNNDKIFRVITHSDGYDFKQTRTPYLLATTLKNEFPQIIKSTQTANVRHFQIENNNEFISIDGCTAATSDLMEMFTIPIVQSTGSSKLLNDRKSILLSQSLANELFGSEDILNNVLTCIINNKEETFTVTGVYKNIPENSTFHPTCLINSSWTLESVNAETSWEMDNWETWIMLNKKNDASSINNSFASFVKKYSSENSDQTYSLQSLKDVYLHSENILDSTAKGNLKNIHLFLSIAFIIILLASLNYILLSLTISGSRAKEIGIRKINGASISNLRSQRLSESILLSLLSTPFSLVLLYFSLPFTSKLFDTELMLIKQNAIFYILVFLGIPLLTGFFSGLYSAYYLSNLKTISILKPTNAIFTNKTFFRTGIIIAELVIFCGFISSTLIIKSQHHYCLNENPGYKNEDRLFINTGYKFDNYLTYKNAISANPLIINVAGSMESFPSTGCSSFPISNYKDPDVKVKVEVLGIDYGFVETMGIGLKEGRSFSESFQTDREKAIILNESAVKKLEITDPIGKTFDEFQIIGIAKDFKLHGFYNAIPPVCIVLAPKENINQIVVQYQHGRLNETVAYLKDEWKKLDIDKPFEFQTVADATLALYQKEENLVTIVSLATLFAFIISILGIFGLTLFIARTRTKEIGIRKVLGSSQQSIIYSFLKNNIIAVIIAGIISTPISYYFMNQWLSNFSYHISINPVFYFISILIALVIVCITVITQSYYSANKNPVEALRFE
jgi:putative ABC transport system permease protein